MSVARQGDARQVSPPHTSGKQLAPLVRKKSDWSVFKNDGQKVRSINFQVFLCFHFFLFALDDLMIVTCGHFMSEQTFKGPRLRVNEWMLLLVVVPGSLLSLFPPPYAWWPIPNQGGNKRGGGAAESESLSLRSWATAAGSRAVFFPFVSGQRSSYSDLMSESFILVCVGENRSSCFCLLTIFPSLGVSAGCNGSLRGWPCVFPVFCSFWPRSLCPFVSLVSSHLCSRLT